MKGKAAVENYFVFLMKDLNRCKAYKNSSYDCLTTRNDQNLVLKFSKKMHRSKQEEKKWKTEQDYHF